MPRAMNQGEPQIAQDTSETRSIERPSGPPDIKIKSRATAPNPLLLPVPRNHVLIKWEGGALKTLRFSDGAGKTLAFELWYAVDVGDSLQNGGEVEYEITFEADGVEQTVSGKVKRS